MKDLEFRKEIMSNEFRKDHVLGLVNEEEKPLHVVILLME